MVYGFPHVDNGPGGDGPVLTVDGNDPASACHVVDLVLGVRILRVRLARGKDVQTHAEPWGYEELVIELAGLAVGGNYVVQIKCVHNRHPLTGQGGCGRVPQQLRQA